MLQPKMSDAANKRFYDELWPHAAALLRTAEVLCRHQQEAEDLVQEAFVKAFRAIDSLKPGTNPKAWLMTILRHAHLDRVRARVGKTALSLESLKVDLPAGEVGPTDVDTSMDALIERLGDQQMINAVRTLPVDISWSVLLVDVEGLTYPEAAAILDVPVGTAKSRVFRGRAMLRELLALNGSPAAKRLE